MYCNTSLLECLASAKSLQRYHAMLRRRLSYVCSLARAADHNPAEHTQVLIEGTPDDDFILDTLIPAIANQINSTEEDHF